MLLLLPGTWEELNASLPAAILCEDDEEPKVSDEAKVFFYAGAELEVRYLSSKPELLMKVMTTTQGEVVPLVLHPVLSKYLLKLDIANQPVDHDYDLPNEELTSAAVHPPMPSLTLDNYQRYPQIITIEASCDSPGTGVTVQDVLRAIHEDMSSVARRRGWTKLNAQEKRVVDDAFRDRCKTEEELCQGPWKIDFLGVRNRLQVLPKLSPDGEVHPQPMTPVGLERIFASCPSVMPFLPSPPQIAMRWRHREPE